jgi:hypothetical protein
VGRLIVDYLTTFDGTDVVSKKITQSGQGFTRRTAVRAPGVGGFFG